MPNPILGMVCQISMDCCNMSKSSIDFCIVDLFLMISIDFTTAGGGWSPCYRYVVTESLQKICMDVWMYFWNGFWGEFWGGFWGGFWDGFWDGFCVDFGSICCSQVTERSACNKIHQESIQHQFWNPPCKSTSNSIFGIRKSNRNSLCTSPAMINVAWQCGNINMLTPFCSTRFCEYPR